MLFCAFFVQHLTETPKGVASSFANHNFRIVQPSLHKWPEAVKMRLNEERAAFNDNAKSSDRCFTHASVRGCSELSHLLKERREHLCRGQRSRQDIDDSECCPRWHIVVGVRRFRFCANRQQSSHDGTGKIQ